MLLLLLWMVLVVAAAVEKKLQTFPLLAGFGSNEHVVVPSIPSDGVVHRGVAFVADAIFPDEGGEKHAWHYR